MLPGRPMNRVNDRSDPEPDARTAPGLERLLTLIAEVVRHLIAEVAAELGREHPKQRAEEAGM